LPSLQLRFSQAKVFSDGGLFGQTGPDGHPAPRRVDLVRALARLDASAQGSGGRNRSLRFSLVRHEQ
jgi:hypothetical protein